MAHAHGWRVTREGALAIVAVFAASLVVSLVTPFCTRDGVRDPATWVAFVRAHASELKAGETLLVHPPWRDDVERAIVDARVTSARVTSAIAPRHGEALPALVIVREVSGVDVPANLANTERIAREGGLELVRVVRADGDIDARNRDLADDIARAHVEVGFADRTVTCAWDELAARHTCDGLPEWVHVGVEDMIVNGKRERCIWSHPMTGGEVRIRFSDLQIARATLAVAISDTAADNASGATVTTTLVTGERELARIERRGARGFTSTPVALAAGENELEVRVRTPNDGQRHTCFRLTGVER